jgi:hypothetical protein
MKSSGVATGTEMKFAKILKHCRIDKPQHFKLADHDPAERFGLSTDIEDVKTMLAAGVARLEEMQQRLYAHGQWADRAPRHGRGRQGWRHQARDVRH